MWEFDGQFTASKRNEDGTMTAKTFSSHAQARQFVENENDQILAVPHRPCKSHHLTKSGKPVPELTPEQIALKEKAMQQLKGI